MLRRYEVGELAIDISDRPVPFCPSLIKHGRRRVIYLGQKKKSIKKIELWSVGSKKKRLIFLAFSVWIAHPADIMMMTTYLLRHCITMKRCLNAVLCASACLCSCVCLFVCLFVDERGSLDRALSPHETSTMMSVCVHCS